jgi:hypothetical protein
MQIKRVPQPSRAVSRQNHRSADLRIGPRFSPRSGMLIVYLLILAIVATGLTAAYGRNWHYEQMRRAVPHMPVAGGIEPASSTESTPTLGEEDEPLSTPGEEKHDSIGDDVIVRIER